MRFASFAAVVLLGFGCAQSSAVQWTRQDLEPKALQQDQAECNAHARASAARAPAARPLGLGMEGFPSLNQTPPSTIERFQVEHKLRHDCMQGRGYREAGRP
jgi:hypothetical protein